MQVEARFSPSLLHASSSRASRPPPKRQSRKSRREEEPKEEPKKPRPPRPSVPPHDPGRRRSGTAGAEQTTAERKPRLLVPRYAEDFYPAMPREDGVAPGIPSAGSSSPSPATLPCAAAHPRRRRRRAEELKLVDESSYFRSAFGCASRGLGRALSLGRQRQGHRDDAARGTLFSDAARPIMNRPLGVSQGWLQTQSCDFRRGAPAREGRRFCWERFGHLRPRRTSSPRMSDGRERPLELDKGKTTFSISTASARTSRTSPPTKASQSSTTHPRA